MSALLRFAGGLHIVGGPDRRRGRARHRRRRPPAAQGHRRGVRPPERRASSSPPAVCARAAATSCASSRTARRLARQTGLLDSRGRPVRGLPPAGRLRRRCDSEAAWRGAFLAHGSLTEPGRSSALEVTCPGPEAALALVGAARRLGIAAKAREVRGVDRVVVRDGDAIGALLTRLGAHESRARLGGAPDAPRGAGHRQPAGQLRRRQPAPLAPARRSPPAPGSSARWRSSATTSPTTCAAAGALRVEHRQAILEELGQLADPPMTKDAIAGRIRRLLAMADKRAQDLGIPDTEASLTPDMLRRPERLEPQAAGQR